MQYLPSQSRHDDLVDIDVLNDTSPLPPATGEKKTKRVKGPSALNMKANRAVPNIAIWSMMALVSYLVMPILAPALEAFTDFTYLAAMMIAAGLGLGGMLLWKGIRIGDDSRYSNTHMFLFISLGLSLLGWIPHSLTFLLLGPLLIGFGIASFAMIFILAFTGEQKPIFDQVGSEPSEDTDA